MRTPALLILCLSAAPLALAACATTPDEYAEGDPLEGVNRPMHDFNEALAEHVVEPIADAAKSNTSENGRSTTGEVLHRVGNVLDNLGEPKNAVNGALQADVGTVGTAVGRFALNSTVGLLGIYDVADSIGLEEQKEDFGQTLGSWGAPSGPYVVAPVAGPTNTRDVTGMVVDSVLNPAGLIPIPSEAMTAARTGVSAADAIDKAEATAEAADATADPYATERARYEARRQAQIDNIGPPPVLGAPVEHRIDSPDGPRRPPPLRVDATPYSDPDAPQADTVDARTLAPSQPLVIDITPLDGEAADDAPQRLTPRPAAYAD